MTWTDEDTLALASLRALDHAHVVFEGGPLHPAKYIGDIAARAADEITRLQARVAELAEARARAEARYEEQRGLQKAAWSRVNALHKRVSELAFDAVCYHERIRELGGAHHRDHEPGHAIPRDELVRALTERAASLRTAAGRAPTKTRRRWQLSGASEELFAAAAEIATCAFPPKEEP